MPIFKGSVALTGLNATDNPGPGVAVARALRADPDFQGQLIGLAYDALDPGLYAEGLFDACFVIPYPSAGREALFERLAYITQRVRVDVLLPNLDAELPALMGEEERLAELGIRAILPRRDDFERRAKVNLPGLREHGVPVPRSEQIVEVAKLYTLHERMDFPVFVKGPFYGATMARTVDEAVVAFHQVAAKWGYPVIVQESVPGEEVNVCAVGDGEGGLLGAVAMKKLMLTDKGKGWAGVTIRDPALIELARDVVHALRWRGPCEIEARKDADGTLNLIEVNPRFPAWCDLTAGAGQNQLLAVVRMAAGQPAELLPDYRPGVAFVRISIDQIVDISALSAISTLGEILPEQPIRRIL
ncbi:MAG: ATP-grasp domain-containing protein [Alphaproteobacteria bacterium]|nr:ATP-grasp domain-containing protein [Alphaproteobacteria bacterium]